MATIDHCYRCGQNKPAWEFYKGKTRTEGLHLYCKKCRKEMAESCLDLTFKSGLQLRKK